MFDAYHQRQYKGIWLLAACLVAALPVTVFGQATDLAGRVAKLEQSLSNRGLLDLLQEIENLKREAAMLRGELENQAHALDQLKKSQLAAYGDLDHRMQALGGTGPLAAPPPLPVLQAAPEGTVAGAPASQGNLQVQTEGNPAAAVPAPTEGSDAIPAGRPMIDPVTGLATPPAPPLSQDGVMPAPGAELADQADQADRQANAAPMSAPDATLSPLPVQATSDDAGSESAYRDAFALLKSGEYDQAIAAFETFQQQYPDSQYGDNAQFWLAEAHYVKRDFTAALPAYQTMLNRYPASKKLSHAMLKIGYSYSELGQATEARSVLAELQARFPGSAAAQLAAQRIAQLPADN